MPTMIEYRAKDDFKYGGKLIEKGEVWTPEGGRFDDKIIEHGTVYMVDVDEVRGVVEKQKRQPKLKQAQVEALMGWLGEGLELEEIMDRANAFKPKFMPTARQLSYYRNKGGTDGSQEDSGTG